MTDRVHLVTTDGRRGAELRAAELVDALRSRGHHDRLVALRRAARGPRIEADVLGRRHTRHPRTLLGLHRHARSASVVAAHGGDTLSAAAVALLAGGPPLVYETIGDPVFWRRSPAARLQARVRLRFAQMVVVLFPAAADALVSGGVPARKVVVIPTGIDPVRFLPTDAAGRAQARTNLGVDGDRPTVAFVGALSPEKAPRRAIEGLPAGWQLLIAGEGPLRSDLERHIRSTGSGLAIHLLGSLEDVRDVYRASDVVIVPSDSEGVPGVAIEAALCGLPVVASDVGGVASVVVDRRTGRLVPAGDVASLREALVEALDHRDWGAAARERAIDRFCLDRWVDGWDDLLVSVADR